MSYRHMNFGANISWNKKERVHALLHDRCPRRRPTNRDEIPACIQWNQFAKLVDGHRNFRNMEEYAHYLGYDDSEAWFKSLVRQAKEDSKYGSVRPRFSNDIEEDRTDRQLQGGSRKKGGRVGWPSMKTIK